METSLQGAVRNTPKPPEPPKNREYRSFAKLEEHRVYLIDGVEFNQVAEDTVERFEQVVADNMAQGAPEAPSRSRAYQERLEKFGISKEHGFYGEKVKPWFPGNTAVLLKPIKHKHTLQYYANHAEAIDNALMKIIMVTENMIQVQSGVKDIEPFPENPTMGCIEVPGLGPMYGPLNLNQTELVAFILSCHGKIVGQHPSGEFLLEEITEDELMDLIPHNFINTEIDPDTGMTVFDEVLTVSTLFNLDLIEKEMVADSVIKDDEVKKSTTSRRGKGTRTSETKPLKTEIAEAA